MLAAPIAFALALVVATGNPATLDCMNPIPPIDNEGDRFFYFEHATAVGPLAAPVDNLKAQARDDLVRKLCRLPTRADCEPLAAKVRDWQTGHAGSNQCAMAVIRADEVESWRRSLAPSLEVTLKELAAKLTVGAKAVVISRIDDGGSPGGARASWFLNHFAAALTAAGVGVVEPPATWNGSRPVRPADRMLRCELVQKVDPVRQIPVVEATWKSSADGVTWMAQPPVSFPAAMAPSPPATTAAIRAKGSDLSLYVDSRSDGSLCHGEQTQIFVANRGPKPLHVRVLNLDTKGNVLVLFPNDQRAVDIIAPGESMALGDEPFTVTGAVGERERYVVLAAENPKGLGRFQRVAPTGSACRFRDDEARRLQNGIGLDAPQVAESGFTILDEPVCRDRPTKTQEEIGLEQIPWCPER